MSNYNKLRAGTLVNLVGELGRLGFKFDIQKYPNMRNKWKIVMEFPAGCKANLSTVLGNNLEMVKLQDAVRMGGGTFLFNLSAAVGRFGENAVLAALRGKRLNWRITQGGASYNLRDLTLTNILQLQNRSGHGLDVIARITEPRPPAPGWLAIEVKSKMGADVRFPSLSEAQQQSDYVQRKAQAALDGIDRARRAIQRNETVGRSWEDLIPERAVIEEFKDASADRIAKAVARVELDMQGNPVGDIQAGAW